MGSEVEVTAADREKAAEVWAEWIAGCEAMDDLIARALADERAKARAPFLALADWIRELADWIRAYAEFEQDGGRDAGALLVVHGHVRRAAEDPPEVSQT